MGVAFHGEFLGLLFADGAHRAGLRTGIPAELRLADLGAGMSVPGSSSASVITEIKRCLAPYRGVKNRLLQPNAPSPAAKAACLWEKSPR